jgi:hypothetical protein
MLKKLLTWGLIVFAIYYVATQPAGAAAFAHHAGHGIHSLAASLAQLVNSL